MAEHLTLIVRAATAGEGGRGWVSALPCTRRPGRRPCPGHLALLRTDVPASIDWQCTACGDDGVIRGWERSPFDLRPRGPEVVSTPTISSVISPEVAATLRGLRLVDRAGERLVFRALATDDGVVLAADEDGLGALLDNLAAETNHEKNRHRRKRLDQAFEVLSDLVEQAR